MGLFGGDKNPPPSNRHSAAAEPAAESLDQRLDGLGQEATVADLMREKGQRRRVKVMNENALRSFIAEAVEAAMLDNGLGADRPFDRAALAEQVTQGLQSVIERNKQVHDQQSAALETHRELSKRLLDLAERTRGISFEDVDGWRKDVSSFLEQSNDHCAVIRRLQSDVERISRLLQA